MSFDTLELGSLRLSVVRRVVIGFPQPPRRMTRWRWVPSASASFDTLSLGSLRLRVFRHVDVGFLPPRRHSTRWRWIPSASVSFDTLALGSLHLGVVRHIGGGFPSPPCLSTRWHWVPFTSASFDTSELGSFASVSFDTLTLGPLHLRHSVVASHLVWFAMGLLHRPAVRVAIGGLLRGDWTCHVIRGPPGRRGGGFGSFTNGRVVDVAWACRGGKGVPKWSVVALER